ncbi:hypothetical protein T07_4583 [Trichinella nelsoni]|uniref:Uncharacterized protein n=1 Tax=Trichinella nelsoni TaxID=6336 RepID=A0A0V0S0T8_9BILA|nr:hypothetical protein T07_4583 [Trichinella nelsoni]
MTLNCNGNDKFTLDYNDLHIYFRLLLEMAKYALHLTLILAVLLSVAFSEFIRLKPSEKKKYDSEKMQFAAKDYGDLHSGISAYRLIPVLQASKKRQLKNLNDIEESAIPEWSMLGWTW